MEAKVSLQARRELIFRIKDRYQNADKPFKISVLPGFVDATGYGRKHAITVLSAAELSRESLRPPVKTRMAKYDVEVQQALSTCGMPLIKPAKPLSKSSLTWFRGCS